MEYIINSIFTLKSYLSTYFIIPVICLVGIFFSFKLNFLQVSKIGYAFRCLIKPSTNKGISSFAALAAVLGGNLGTGNIAGIAFGLSVGGPGTLFWMWVMAFLGSILKYVGCFLGIKYRVADKKYGGTKGGPMYYLANGINSKFLAKTFCLLCIFGAFSVGNLVQVNSISLPLIKSGINPFISSLFMALAIAFVIFKGKQWFLSFTSKFVPIMALSYISSCIIILVINSDKLLPAINLIFYYAFNTKSVVGGATSYLIFDAMRAGFDRGLFATDAGTGLAPILHSEVTNNGNEDKFAFDQGMIAVIAPFLVMTICTITGLTLLVTGVWQDSSLQSTNMCIKAFNIGFNSPAAGNIVTLTLWLFAFTTMLTWAHCSERSFNFLLPKVPSKLYRFIFIAMVPLGVIAPVSLVWLIADVAINLMLLVNLCGLLGLASIVIIETKHQVKALKTSSESI